MSDGQEPIAAVDDLTEAEARLKWNLSGVWVEIDEAARSSDRDLAALFLRRARRELITAWLEALADFEQEREAAAAALEGQRVEARRVAAELAAVREQLQAIGRKAFWASKGG